MHISSLYAELYMQVGGHDKLRMSPQGLMWGYATDETEEMMPLTLLLAHNMNRRLAELRRNGTLPWAGPDSKSQVYGLVRVVQG